MSLQGQGGVGASHAVVARAGGLPASSGKTHAFSRLAGTGPAWTAVGTLVRNQLLRLRTAELIRRAGGLALAASRCRVSKSTLARYASTNPDDAECFVPIDVVTDLERYAGAPLVTAELCLLAGGAFVAHPVMPPCRQDLLVQLAAQAREQSDLTTAICLAVADGVVSRDEAALALLEQEEVLRLGAAMRARLMLIVEEAA